MASPFVSCYIAFSLLCLCALSTEPVDEKKPPFSFEFDRFEQDRSFDSRIALYGDAEVSNSTIQLISKARAMCKKPIRFLGTNPSFSTNFSFSMSKGNGGSFAFLLVPKKSKSKSKTLPKFLAVEFASHYNGTHLAVDVAGKISNVDLGLDGSRKLHSWIDYDDASKTIEVRVSEFGDLRPSSSQISFSIDLSYALWRERMYVGLSYSSENSTQSSNVYSWSFVVKHGAPYLMHSRPLNPESFAENSYEDSMTHSRRSFHWKILMALLVGAIFGAFIAWIAFSLRSKVVNRHRHPIAPIVEAEHEKIVVDSKKDSADGVK